MTLLTLSTTYIFAEHVVGLEAWMLAIVVGSHISIGPATFQTATGPGIVIMFAELLNQRVQIVVQMHIVCIDGIWYILWLIWCTHLPAIVILVGVLGQTVIWRQSTTDGDEAGQCLTEQFRVIVHVAQRVKNVREQKHGESLLLI